MTSNDGAAPVASSHHKHPQGSDNSRPSLLEQPLPKKPKADTAAATATYTTEEVAKIPPSDTLLNSRLHKELQEAWAAARRRPPLASTESNEKRQKPVADVAAVVPPFKVGTLEMYRRFPQAYDMLMCHHNCAAVQATLLNDILGRIVETSHPTCSETTTLPSPSSASQPWIRVADFGCGTGRIEAMVVQHPAVKAIYAYDSEVPMLKQCLVNTVRSVAQARHRSGVRLCSVASGGRAELSSTPPVMPSRSSLPRHVLLCSDTETPSTHAGASSSSSPAVPPSPHTELELCLRPVPFQAIQDGFLATTQHPRCSLIVCAWSLSYVMRMQWGEDHWHSAVDTVVQHLLDQLDTSTSDAAVVVLETLGNGAAEPTRQNTYTQRLEKRFGFTRAWVRTDYEFASRVEAERMVRFFFGEKMLAKVSCDAVEGEQATQAEACRLMECTGIWTLWKRRGE